MGAVTSGHPFQVENDVGPKSLWHDASKMKFRAIPPHLLTLGALLSGILLGGTFPQQLEFLSRAAVAVVRILIQLVPLLILVALSPALATLIRQRRAASIGGSLIAWYLSTSLVAGLLGAGISFLLFEIPLHGGVTFRWSILAEMLGTLGSGEGVTRPLLAIAVAFFLALLSLWWKGLARGLSLAENKFTLGSRYVAFWLAPIVFCLGLSVGVRFGAMVGVSNYILMTAYTALLCFCWWLLYVFVFVRLITGQPVGRLLRVYYLPTAIFAASSCSSLLTLPVNLARARQYGVSRETADTVIPVGAVFNLDASALAYVAYGPFVLGQIFQLEISWTMLLAAWPAIVLFTVAAPGLPAGMGTALWSATLFVSLLDLEEPLKSEVVATWMALSGGFPDMFRTATNCTDDGFTAIIFDHFHKRRLAPSRVS